MLCRMRALVTVVCVLAVGLAALAQFMVFDPANYEEAIQQFLQLEQQYVQLVQTYRLLAEQARRLPVDMATRYRGLRTPWRSIAASDTYGTNVGWILTANTGGEALAGYRRATQPLEQYQAALAHMPAEEQSRVRTGYGTVELADGISVQGLWTLGRLRNHAGAVETALRSLEDDSYSSDPSMNTQVAVLNKINAAAVTAIRMGQDTNQLLVSILEQHLVDAKRRRDADAVAINAHIAFETQARDLLRQASAGTTDALTNFRLP